MTNKKLKFAAMSVALTACVAAQPLAAHAVEDLGPVADDPAPEQNEPSEASFSSEETVEEIKNETLNPDPEPSEDMDVKEAFGDDVDIKYDPDKATKDEETGTVTTPGDVIRKEDPDQPGETEETDKTGETDPSGSTDETGKTGETDPSGSTDETGKTGETDGSEEAGEVIGSAERNETDESSSNTVTRTKSSTDTNTIEGQLLAIREATYQQTVKGEVTDGTDRYGRYTVDYVQDFGWKDSEDETTKVKGEFHGSYTTFKDLIHKIFRGKNSGKEEGGSFRYSYKTEKDAELAPVSKTETSVKHAEVKYDYTTIDTAHVLIPGETTVVVTLEDPDLPAPDDETPVVTPETPELPPVQDATPDAEPTTDVVITPATPELPPVQDAAPDVISALPKTGVNWTAAIGMALSGMALMAAGAFTSLFHKAKH